MIRDYGLDKCLKQLCSNLYKQLPYDAAWLSFNICLSVVSYHPVLDKEIKGGIWKVSLIKITFLRIWWCWSYWLRKDNVDGGGGNIGSFTKRVDLLVYFYCGGAWCCQSESMVMWCWACGIQLVTSWQSSWSFK